MRNAYSKLAGTLSRSSSVGLLVVRALAGWLLILHASGKFNLGRANVANYVMKPAHLPLPHVLAWAAPTFELVVGIMLILGLVTRVAAVLVVGEMLVTGLWVKLHEFNLGVLGPKMSGGAEVDFLMLAGMVALVFLGPGVISADDRLGLDRSVVGTETPRTSSRSTSRVGAR